VLGLSNTNVLSIRFYVAVDARMTDILHVFGCKDTKKKANGQIL
jgi:hypothetical protein